jgi:addiction module RelE/StbE family toxin
LPQRIKDLAEKKETIFIKEPFSKMLETHKLHGEFTGFLAFSVNKSYRIVFDFIDENTVRFYDIGTHDIYK